MSTAFDKLCNEYKKKKKNNSKLYIYDDVDTLGYEDIHKEGYRLNVKLIKVEDTYKVFFFVLRLNELLLNYLILDSTTDISDNYESIKKDMLKLSMDDFISKYCVKK